MSLYLYTVNPPKNIIQVFFVNNQQHIREQLSLILVPLFVFITVGNTFNRIYYVDIVNRVFHKYSGTQEYRCCQLGFSCAI